MTGLPPSLLGADQATTALPLLAVALTPPGAPGTVLGVTALLGALAGLVPTLLVAVTENV